MNKYFLLLFFSCSTIVFPTSHAHAFSNDLCSTKSDGFNGRCDAAASKYDMTMKGFRLRRADTNEFVTITTNTQTYDFAAVNAGDTVGSYLTDGTIPVGTYDAVSPILAPDLSVKGTVTLTGGTDTCRIATGGGNIADGGASDTATFSMQNDAGTPVGSDAVEGMDRTTDKQYINSDGDYVLVDSSITGFPVTIAEGDSLSFSMNISVAQSITYQFNGTNCVASFPAGIQVNLAATVTRSNS